MKCSPAGALVAANGGGAVAAWLPHTRQPEQSHSHGTLS